MADRQRQAERRFCVGAAALCILFSTVSPLRAGGEADGSAGTGEVNVEAIPVQTLLREPGKIAPSNCVGQRITFSTGSSWSMCVKAVSRYGLIVSHASFRRSPTASPILVLSDARLGEIFVPYHQGFPRLADIAFSAYPVLPLSADSATRSDCPAPRVRMDGNLICRETRDSGIAMKNDSFVRRGREVSFFSVLDADNYNYIVEWTFRDDGTILARAGATGTKLNGPDDTKGHMHNFTWRLDIDLNGAAGDSACIHRHRENLGAPRSTATDSCDPIPFETGLQWDPLQFNSIVVSDSVLKNGRGRQTQYELIPLRLGSARHTELFTRNDFWITRSKSNELLALTLPQFANGEAAIGQDNVLWYTGSIDHEDHMRDEDRDVVPVIWVGFELHPRNLFDDSPFFCGLTYGKCER